MTPYQRLQKAKKAFAAFESAYVITVELLNDDHDRDWADGAQSRLDEMHEMMRFVLSDAEQTYEQSVAQKQAQTHHRPPASRPSEV